MADREEAPALSGSSADVAVGLNGATLPVADVRLAGPAGPDYLQRLKDIAQDITLGIAALVALASVVYLLGGTVLAGRLMMYRLPWEIVIDQLPQSFLVAIGLTEVVMPLVGVGLLYLLILFTAWKVEALFEVTPGLSSQQFRNALRFYQRLTGPFGEILLWSLFGVLVLVIARLAGAGNGWNLGQCVIAAVLAISGAVATYLVLEQFKNLLKAETTAKRLFKPFRKLGTMWADPSSMPWLRGATVAVALLPLIAWNAITLPLPYAQVCPTKTIPSAGGWLIGQTNDRLILGGPDDPPGKRHIVLTPSTGAMILATYQNPKVVRLPSCPTIGAGG